MYLGFLGCLIEEENRLYNETDLFFCRDGDDTGEDDPADVDDHVEPAELVPPVPNDDPPSDSQESKPEVKETESCESHVPAETTGGGGPPAPQLSQADFEEMRGTLREAAREASDLLENVEY